MDLRIQGSPALSGAWGTVGVSGAWRTKEASEEHWQPAALVSCAWIHRKCLRGIARQYDLWCLPAAPILLLGSHHTRGV